MFGAAGFNHRNHTLVTILILLPLEPTVLPRRGQMLVLVLFALQQFALHYLTLALCTKCAIGKQNDLKKKKKHVILNSGQSWTRISI